MIAQTVVWTRWFDEGWAGLELELQAVLKLCHRFQLAPQDWHDADPVFMAADLEDIADEAKTIALACNEPVARTSAPRRQPFVYAVQLR